MREVLLAFGRGLVKFLVSLFVGSGVGLFLFGFFTRGQPTGELFLAIGAGLLSAGVMLLLLFGIPWLRGRPRPQERREQPLSEKPSAGASRAE